MCLVNISDATHLSVLIPEDGISSQGHKYAWMEHIIAVMHSNLTLIQVVIVQ